MGRIRTIKPEFPCSASIGRISRDARLLFVQLFTVADDHGRCRAAAPVLAGQLYPWDNLCHTDLNRWLDELQGEEMIFRYDVKGTPYLQIINWKKHQKVTRPGTSRMPHPPSVQPSFLPEDGNGAVQDTTKCNDSHCTDLGPRTIGPRILDSSLRSESTDSAEEDWQETLNRQLYAEGAKLLGHGKGGVITKWLRGCDRGKLLEILQDANRRRPFDPIAYVTAAVEKQKRSAVAHNHAAHRMII